VKHSLSQMPATSVCLTISTKPYPLSNIGSADSSIFATHSSSTDKFYFTLLVTVPGIPGKALAAFRTGSVDTTSGGEFEKTFLDISINVIPLNGTAKPFCSFSMEYLSISFLSVLDLLFVRKLDLPNEI